MFQKNDLIFYGSAGVCRVDDISKPPKNYPVGQDQLYYKLTPLYDTSEIFTPVDTKVFMRPVINRSEAEALIRRIPAIGPDDFASDKRMELMDHYRGLLNSHSCETLLRLIKTLYLRAQNNIHLGRTPSAMEQDFRKRAEHLVYGELAVALNTTVQNIEEEVTPAIEASGQLAREA